MSNPQNFLIFLPPGWPAAFILPTAPSSLISPLSFREILLGQRDPRSPVPCSTRKPNHNPLRPQQKKAPVPHPIHRKILALIPYLNSSNQFQRPSPSNATCLRRTSSSGPCIRLSSIHPSKSKQIRNQTHASS